MPAFTQKFQGKKVLIIGGSSGIGLAVAQGVLEFGGEVVIASSKQASIDAAVKKLEGEANAQGRVSGHVLNLKRGTLQDMDKDIEALLVEVGTIDHFVHTAGDALYISPVPELDLDKVTDAYRVRHLAPMAAAKHLTKHKLIKEGGSLVLTAGSAYLKPIPGWVASCGLLGATVAMTKSLACELAPIRVNVVTPGPVHTEMWDTHTDDVPGMMKEYGKTCLTGKVADPTDTAEGYLYCMRDSSVTGEEIVTDCGGRYK